MYDEGDPNATEDGELLRDVGKSAVTQEIEHRHKAEALRVDGSTHSIEDRSGDECRGFED